MLLTVLKYWNKRYSTYIQAFQNWKLILDRLEDYLVSRSVPRLQYQVFFSIIRGSEFYSGVQFVNRNWNEIWTLMGILIVCLKGSFVFWCLSAWISSIICWRLPNIYELCVCNKLFMTVELCTKEKFDSKICGQQMIKWAK